MYKWFLKGCLIIVIILTMAPAAFAVHSLDDAVEQTVRTGWDKAMAQEDGKKCTYCHSTQPEHTSGPHGGYQSTTDKCVACHTVHKAQNESLLPGKTVAETCNFCHDLTQSEVAPYYTDYMTTESEVKSAHRVDGLAVKSKTNNWVGEVWEGSLIIPGGDPITGDSATLNTTHQGTVSKNNFTCDSCHTPHAIDDSTVEPYLGESQLKFEIADNAIPSAANGNAGRFWITDRLLKARLNGVSGFVYTKYNSDWCAACHQGRFDDDGSQIHNHPVAMNSQAENTAERENAMGYQFLDFLAPEDFDAYLNKESLIAAAKDENGIYRTFYWATPEAYSAMGNTIDYTVGAKHVTGVRTIKKDPRTNKQYSMTAGDPLNSNQARPDGHVPITEYPKGPACQQCHGNPRNVEETFLASLEVSNGKRVMSFPHVSMNENLTVENNDDFCTNCHGLENLP